MPHLHSRRVCGRVRVRSVVVRIRVNRCRHDEEQKDHIREINFCQDSDTMKNYKDKYRRTF